MLDEEEAALTTIEGRIQAIWEVLLQLLSALETEAVSRTWVPPHPISMVDDLTRRRVCMA